MTDWSSSWSRYGLSPAPSLAPSLTPSSGAARSVAADWTPARSPDAAPGGVPTPPPPSLTPPGGAASSVAADWTAAGSTYEASGCVAAKSAAAAPVRWPNPSRSESELPPSRFAPCIPPATSPAATRPGRDQPWAGRCPGLGVDPDAAHDVVGRRPDLHGSRRDVDVGQLLELL